MFYAVNRITATEGKKIAAYQLFQIAKKLTSGQLLYLKASHDMYKTRDFRAGQLVGSGEWFAKVGKKLGHQVIGLLAGPVRRPSSVGCRQAHRFGRPRFMRGARPQAGESPPTAPTETLPYGLRRCRSPRHATVRESRSSASICILTPAISWQNNPWCF
jgi:hypothetical protein